jgi:hypothetical protein
VRVSADDHDDDSPRRGRTHPAPRLGRPMPSYGLSVLRRTNSGSLAILAAMGRASSRVSSYAADRRLGSSSI